MQVLKEAKALVKALYFTNARNDLIACSNSTELTPSQVHRLPVHQIHHVPQLRREPRRLRLHILRLGQRESRLRRAVSVGNVARWQNVIPSFPWIVPGWGRRNHT